MRRKINKQGAGTCSRCMEFLFAHDLEIDHRRPLGLGGADTDGNIQVLCRPCHSAKSRSEYSTHGSD